MKVPELVRGPVVRDGREGWYICCPDCGLEAWADLDRLHGRVPIVCPETGCTYRETVRIFTEERATP